MDWHLLEDRQKIMRIMNQLISNKTEIKVRINGEKSPFISKLLKIDEADVLLENLEIGKEPQLIIEKLNPAKGNDLIQSFPDVTMEFSVNENLCRCSVQNTGVNNIAPHFGFIMSYPEALEIEEKREEERTVYERPEFVSVEFRLKKGGKRDKIYSLNVIDRSGHGFGLLITQKDFDLLRVLNPGVRLKQMKLYSESIMITMDGIVRHKTKIEEGKYKGCYIVGIESADIVKR